ncbi:fluoride efflux transporter FluC [Desulfonatronum lacustre]|uniref:fluoride efflux transporter FluC n=1 Tax=Desulfonatronum lacustre TaxID=66849 RepID=UPI0024035385|nr:camphor resistance protein CrcB [Desulfonatronum zhilinae]
MTSVPERLPSPPLSPMATALLIGLFGAAGALARYGISSAASLLPGPFPWGTSLANVLGCFLFGLIWALSEQRALIPKPLGLVLLTGFVGSFTTFSTYVFEAEVLLQQGLWLILALKIIGQNLLGFAALAAGFRVGWWGGER